MVIGMQMASTAVGSGGGPVAKKINKAASGKKAWVTNLDGDYKNNETGYLFSPCFNIGRMKNPTLECKMALDIENCGIVLCDLGIVEYSASYHKCVYHPPPCPHV